MISSMNAYGGLSANQLLSLFGANSPSTSTSQAAASPQSAPADAATGSVNDPASTIKAILAEAQISQGSGATLGGWSVTRTAQAAYASQTGGAGVVSASVTIASAGAAQQINDAVALINRSQVMRQTFLDPATNNGISSMSSPVTVSANNAVNIDIGDGVASVTAMQGANFPQGLPSLTTIQQVLGNLKSRDEEIGFNGVEATSIDNAKATADNWWNSTFNGSFTVIQLPSGNVGGDGAYYTTFTDGANNWALVIPHNSVTASVSVTTLNAK